MKCHYEVLNVPRDADDTLIKSAYKKLALKWHPDKNLDNPEEAKEQFQLVQQAYEILSDRQERAWYDNHREQILHASDSNFEDKSLDVFQYFNTGCYKGYSDDDNGFYAVYRKVFEQIAEEDMEYIENKEEFCGIPTFGNSASDYESVVAPFYAYWSSYSTKKSYVWLDPHKINEIKGGKILKIVEKENKKVRQKAKKERNEEVRNLVAFVRKRDKRVQANIKLQEAKNLANRKKQEQISIQRRLERQKLLNQSGTQAEWTKFDNVEAELEQIERHLAEEFGASESEDEYSLYNNNLYCIACKKLFRKEKAFQAHESTKKHKENLEKLRSELLETQSSLNDSDNSNTESTCEDGEASGIDEEHDGEESSIDQNAVGEIIAESESCTGNSRKKKKKGADQMKYLDENSDISFESDSEAEADIAVKDIKVTKQKKKKKQNILKADLSLSADSDKEAEILPPVVESDNDCDFSSTDKQKKKNGKKKRNKGKQQTKPVVDSKNDVQRDNPMNLSEDVEQPKNNIENCNDCSESKIGGDEKVKVKKSTANPKQYKTQGNKKNRKRGDNEVSEIDSSHCCVSCKAEFSSKNKLFDHLKKTGHSVYLPSSQSKTKGKK